MEEEGSRLQRAQEDVEMVRVIMQENVMKVDERGHKLSDLDDRAEELLAKSKTFEKKSVQIKQKKMWANNKTRIIFIVVGVVVAVAILAIIISVSLNQ